jgi:hypothetical protein
MSTAKSWFTVSSIAIAVAMFLTASTARADTYQIYDLGDANDRTPTGIDASGAVVIADGLHFTYTIFVDGGEISESSTPPPLFAYDNGTPCSPALSSGMTVIGKAACNGGYEVFGGQYLDAARGIYTGPDPADFLQAGTVDVLLLNSSGDFVWADGRDEENFEAIDLTSSQVPEPSSIFLLSTGLFAISGLRRRLFQ